MPKHSAFVQATVGKSRRASNQVWASPWSAGSPYVNASSLTGYKGYNYQNKGDHQYRPPKAAPGHGAM